jgi:hypothetical protein
MMTNHDCRFCGLPAEVLLASEPLCAACAHGVIDGAAREAAAELAWRTEQVRPENLARRARVSAEVASEIAEGRSPCVSLRVVRERWRVASAAAAPA